MTPAQIAVLMEFAGSDEGVEVSYPPSIVNELAGAQLVTLDGKQLTDRGRAYVDHVCSLGLPEQVTVWAIPGHGTPPMIRPDYARSLGALPLGPITAGDEDEPPPPAPPAKRINGIDVPTDPAAKRDLGIRLMNNGMGVGEVAELLGVTFDEADSYFRSQ